MKKFLTQLFNIEEENLKEKIRLEEGIYRVKLYRVNEKVNYTLDTLKKNPFINDKSLYISHNINNSTMSSPSYSDDEILIKYNGKDDYVTEFKTGIKIPIVCFYSDSIKNKKSQVVVSGYEENCFPIICVGMSFKKYKTPMATYISDEDRFKTYDRIIDEQAFEGSISSFNLLNLSSRSLDEMVEEYNKLYPDEKVLEKNILRPITEFNEKKQAETKRAKEKELEELRKQEEKKKQTKRNYEKYYYVDGDVKKDNRKRLFRK